MGSCWSTPIRLLPVLQLCLGRKLNWQHVCSMYARAGPTVRPRRVLPRRPRECSAAALWPMKAIMLDLALGSHRPRVSRFPQHRLCLIPKPFRGMLYLPRNRLVFSTMMPVKAADTRMTRSLRYVHDHSLDEPLSHRRALPRQRQCVLLSFGPMYCCMQQLIVVSCSKSRQ